MSRHDKYFPNESAQYREQRNALLDKELALRTELAELAALRQQLPLGGQIKEDYAFTDVKSGSTVTLSALFEANKSLILYSFMFAPDADSPCPMCHSITDAFNGTAAHVNDRASFAVVCKAPAEKMQAWAKQHHWDKLRILSSFNNTYNADYHAETDSGEQLPALNVFTQHDGKIYHFYALEALYAKVEGQPRHADLLWPLWNLLDLTPEGRGTDWYPRFSY